MYLFFSLHVCQTGTGTTRRGRRRITHLKWHPHQARGGGSSRLKAAILRWQTPRFLSSPGVWRIRRYSTELYLTSINNWTKSFYLCVHGCFSSKHPKTGRNKVLTKHWDLSAGAVYFTSVLVTFLNFEDLDASFTIFGYRAEFDVYSQQQHSSLTHSYVKTMWIRWTFTGAGKGSDPGYNTGSILWGFRDGPGWAYTPKPSSTGPLALLPVSWQRRGWFLSQTHVHVGFSPVWIK